MYLTCNNLADRNQKKAHSLGKMGCEKFFQKPNSDSTLKSLLDLSGSVFLNHQNRGDKLLDFVLFNTTYSRGCARGILTSLYQY